MSNNRPRERSLCFRGAPLRTLLPPTETNRPDCARAGEDTAIFRSQDDWCVAQLQGPVRPQCESVSRVMLARAEVVATRLWRVQTGHRVVATCYDRHDK